MSILDIAGRKLAEQSGGRLLWDDRQHTLVKNLDYVAPTPQTVRRVTTVEALPVDERAPIIPGVPPVEPISAARQAAPAPAPQPARESRPQEPLPYVRDRNDRGPSDPRFPRDLMGLAQFDAEAYDRLLELLQHFRIDPDSTHACWMAMNLAKALMAQDAFTAQPQQPQPAPEPRRDTRQPAEPPVQPARAAQAAPAPRPVAPPPQTYPGRIIHRRTAEEEQLIREQSTLEPGDLGIPLYDCGHCGKPVDPNDKKCPHCGADLTQAQTLIEDVIVLGPAEEQEGLGDEAAAAFSARFGEDNVHTGRPRGKRRKSDQRRDEDDIPAFLRRDRRN